QLPDHVEGGHAEPHRPPRGLLDADYSHEHPVRGNPVLPWDRRAAPDTVVGIPAVGRQPDLRRRLVDDVLPWDVPAVHDPGLQSGGGRTARRTRSQDGRALVQEVERDATTG